jgi:phosphoheptose isomerase|tara:strand:- start:3269 stop:3832 length:564 start_codon:yes stop_codon:yes gene_type:complete
MEEKIFNHFQKMIEATMLNGESHTEAMAGAAEKVASALLAGNTIFTLGEKSGVLIAQLFSDYLALGYEIDRPGFPSINLNQITQNSNDAERYNQALNTHGKGGDILVLVSAGNNEQLLINALNSAVNRGMTIVLLSAANDDLLASSVSYNDIHISSADFSAPLATQSQLQVIQCVCGLIDSHIFGGE